MTTISLSYNERNVAAQKAIDFLLSLGLFKVNFDTPSAAKKKTLAAIREAKEGRNVTRCATFEDYLKAVAE